MPDSPSATRQQLHQISDADACALVDATLGAPKEWRSPIIQYRFTSDFQAHFKAEVGHWVWTARQHGYESRLVARTRDRANSASPRIPDAVTTKDGLYRVLLEELYPAMVAHYFLRTGWAFRGWDEPDGAGGDIDLAVTTPSGKEVDLQIKVPGTVDPLASLDKAATQLASSKNRRMVMVCSRDDRFLSCEPNPLLSGLIGHTVQEYGVVRVTETGRFAEPAWRAIGGVGILDYLPTLEREVYVCTLLTNPWARPDATLDAGAFPHARMLVRDGAAVKWVPGEPDRAFFVPDGTILPR